MSLRQERPSLRLKCLLAGGIGICLALCLLGCGGHAGGDPAGTDTDDGTAAVTVTEPAEETAATTDPIQEETQMTTEIETETERETLPETQAPTASSAMLDALSDTDLAVSVPTDLASKKQVGIFYFIWEGTGPDLPQVYDNTKTLANMDLTGKDKITLDEWTAAGGGPKGQFHWWGQPLYGYYDMADEWVVSRHMQLLGEAGVDFIVIDQTNGVLDGYVKRINTVFRAAYDLYTQGVRVPKICFMGYDDGPDTLNKLYYQVYYKHPEWAELYYHWNGHEKPVIFDNIEAYSKTAAYQINKKEKLASYDPAVPEFFEIRDLAFPHETKFGYKGSSLLYLDFRPVPEPVRDRNDGGYSFVNVSVAEICSTNQSTANVLRETPDRSRSWDGEKNLEWHGQPDAWRYGINFARQWEAAIAADPDMVFVTGWNEWIAQLQGGATGSASVALIDNMDINNSRDIEPMAGGYGDNYYLQLCDFITRFKYGAVELTPAGSATVDITRADSWNQPGVVTLTDPVGDGAARSCQQANVPSVVYTAEGADNDITAIRTAADDTASYFCVETADGIRDPLKDGNLVLIIRAGGFLYAVNRTGGTETAMTVEKYADGAWTIIGEAPAVIDGKRLSLSVPASLIPNDGTLSVKWADGITDPADRMSYYTCADSAPFGGLFAAFRK